MSVPNKTPYTTLVWIFPLGMGWAENTSQPQVCRHFLKKEAMLSSNFLLTVLFGATHALVVVVVVVEEEGGGGW